MSFTVMSFNIEGFFSEREEKYSWNKRANLNVEIIQKYTPDLIGFQEVQSGNLIFYHEHLTNYEVYLGVNTITPHTNKKTLYNPIFWKNDKFKKYDSGGFYISQTPSKWSKNWDSMYVRGATWVKLQSVTDGKKFILLNTHLDHYGEQARIEGSKIIVKQIAKIQESDNLPVILTGDFNSRAWVPPNEKVHEYPPPIIPNALSSTTNVYNIYRDFGFLDTYLEAGYTNCLNMNTYHDYYGQIFPSVALRIDWILVFNGLQKLRTKEFVIIRDARSSIYPSDHYPVTTELMWEQQISWDKQNGT